MFYNLYYINIIGVKFSVENLSNISEVELYAKEKQVQFYSILRECVKHHIMILE